VRRWQQCGTAWRVLPDDGQREPRRNLARDEARARGADGSPTLRLGRSDRSVVLGRAQVAAAEVDAQACRDLDVPVLRRFSGGGAVYHDPGNLNLTLVVGREDPLVRARADRGRRLGLYGVVLEPLVAALRRSGVAAVANERGVWIGGRKVSGAAAWVGPRAVLVHATLLVDADLCALERVLAGPGAPDDPRWTRTRSRHAPVTSLAREGIRPPDPAALETGIVAAVTGGRSAPGSLTADERAMAERLFVQRYARPAWHASGETPRGGETAQPIGS
jgi:lipoate-protein ligase A